MFLLVYVGTVCVPTPCPVASAEFPAVEGVRGIQAFPNPTTASVLLQLPGDRLPTSIGILDVSGRLVRTVQDVGAPAGSVLWDGRDEAGTPVPAGVYYVRLLNAGERVSGTVIRIE